MTSSTTLLATQPAVISSSELVSASANCAGVSGDEPPADMLLLPVGSRGGAAAPDNARSDDSGWARDACAAARMQRQKEQQPAAARGAAMQHSRGANSSRQRLAWRCSSAR
jgi:hypothetical protein